MYEDIVVPVRFMPKDGTLAALRTAAAELDVESGLPSSEDEQADWTFAQAITIVFHQAPDRLHEFLEGWMVDVSWDALGRS